MPRSARFFGWNVLSATFVLAIFGWGIGFYGPPVYLLAVVQRTGWSVALVSVAVTVHFLAGTVVVANLPRLYRRLGVARVTAGGAALLAAGVCGWAMATAQWQLFAAALASGMGWVTLGAAAGNALISPWFVARRPAALSMAYNGASVGGILFSPLWVYLIAHFGFAAASVGVGVLLVAVIALMSSTIFARTPEQLGQYPDGVTTPPPATASALSGLPPDPIENIWRDRRFLSLAAGMSIGLFAQIGLIAHMISILVPTLGAQQAGIAMGMATLSAIAGRSLVGWLMPPAADRRNVACLAYGIQIAGSIMLMLGTDNLWAVWLGVLLFGSGIGNATSLPPLIAQAEFAKIDTQRVVPLIVAVSQGTYAFAPALFGLLRFVFPTGHSASSIAFFGVAAALQLAAIACFAAGRRGTVTCVLRT